jgi:hypothetical protein
MTKALSPEVVELIDARKKLKFWYKILLSTDYMDDVKNRMDFRKALKTIKKQIKKLKSGT